MIVWPGVSDACEWAMELRGKVRRNLLGSLSLYGIAAARLVAVATIQYCVIGLSTASATDDHMRDWSAVLGVKPLTACLNAEHPISKLSAALTPISIFLQRYRSVVGRARVLVFTWSAAATGPAGVRQIAGVALRDQSRQQPRQ